MTVHPEPSSLARIPNPAAPPAELAESSDIGEGRNLEERNAEIYRLRVVNRWTLQKIGDRFGISNQRVSQIVDKIREDMPALDAVAIRQESLALYQHIQQEALALAEMAGAPVTAGKDGALVYDPASNEVVRDYALRIQAFALALKADAEKRKLHGVDAPAKIEQSGFLRYEIAGWDTESLSAALS